MPKPSTDSVRRKVVHNIAVISGFPEGAVADDKRLFQDLGMAQESRRALAPGFERIAQETNPDARVTRKECERLLTVKAAVALVEKRATPSPAAV